MRRINTKFILIVTYLQDKCIESINYVQLSEMEKKYVGFSDLICKNILIGNQICLGMSHPHGLRGKAEEIGKQGYLIVRIWYKA